MRDGDRRPPADAATGITDALTRRGAALLAALRRIAGMPDYAAYCAHLRTAHPEQPLPTEREYFDEYLRTRYGAGPTRCC